jgi:uncharacterized protein (DUF58 family)
MYTTWLSRTVEAGIRRPVITRSRSTALNPLSELFTIVLIAVVVVGAVSREPLVAALGGLAFVVAMVSRLWAALSLEEVTIDRSVDTERAFQGDDIEVTFTIENRKRLPIPWIEIKEFVPRGLLVEGAKAIEQVYLGGATLDVSTSLGAYERVRIRRKLTALSRGVYKLGKTDIRSGDLFGLYPSDASLERTQWSIYVYPQIKDLREFRLPSLRPIGDSLSRDRMWQDPSRPSGVREYRPGDPIKHIDWKSTARRGDLFVREFDSSISEHAVIFAEAITTSVPWEGYRSDVLEATMTASASIASAAMNQGFKVGFVTNGITIRTASHAVIPPNSGPGQMTNLLESMAMVQPIGVKTLDEQARSRRGMIPPGAALIHIGGIHHPRTMNYLTGHARAGHPVIVVHVGREEPPEYPQFEVRDGRGMFLETETEVTDFRRPVQRDSSGNWREMPLKGVSR